MKHVSDFKSPLETGTVLVVLSGLVGGALRLLQTKFFSVLVL